MPDTDTNIPDHVAQPLQATVAEHWGYDTFRPLQLPAMAAVVQRRDALVVLPTGGGKSLCYQAPALLAEKPTVVVSPLIALMKDQVDGLIQRGIPAAFMNSSLSAEDRSRVTQGIHQGQYKLIFVAPERLAGDGFFSLLDNAGIGAFAIDEAHCISHWGHDFRADYRNLGQLKRRYPNAPIHAFTATATPRVRDDIVSQLGLTDPTILVGDFFRPNLTYRVTRRGFGFEDLIQAVQERPGQAGIIYCIRRADVDALTAQLQSLNLNAVAYHAGLSDDRRTAAQDAFSAGRADLVVATVAFGMGVDRSDIRFVLHAAMPKSIEHYQQETGRAGRDGQPADCILFYSGADFGLWKHIIQMGDAEEPQTDALDLLGSMYRFCTGMQCRHRKLVTYFGQTWGGGNCGACDFCLDGADPLPESTEIAQKIMSCIARTGQRFGGAHVADVLNGEMTERVTQRGHDQLSTFNLMPDQPKPVIMQWIDQLVDQDLLDRDTEYRTLSITPQGWQVLRSQEPARLYEVVVPQKSKRRRTGWSTGSVTTSHRPKNVVPVTPPRPLDTDERALFERLRILRSGIANEMNAPAFMVFSDKTLREIALQKPTTSHQMLAIKGIGPAKLEAFGQQFIDALQHDGQS